MQMRNGFAAMGSVVYDDSKAFGKTFAAGNSGSGQKKVAEHRLVGLRSLSHARDVLFRNDQNVGGSLGGDVAEGEAQVILEDDVCGNLAG